MQRVYRVVPQAAVGFFRRRLSAAGTPKRATTEKAYLKSDLRFYGATSADVHRAAADFAREHPDLDRASLRAIAEACYATGVHELRSAAIALLHLRRTLLNRRDLSWLIGLVRRSNTWAHVDWLAVGVIGDVVSRDTAALRLLPRWAANENFWVRRTALLAQHDALKAGEGNFALFARLASDMLEEREFFIRKAIGWVLREVSKKRPALVYGFLRSRLTRLSGLTLREGSKYLPVAQRRALGLAPRRHSRGASHARGQSARVGPRSAGR